MTELEPKAFIVPELHKSTTPAKREYPTIDRLFDTAIHIVERMEELVWKAKYLIFGTGFLLFLIYELALFGKHLLKMWDHS